MKCLNKSCGVEIYGMELLQERLYAYDRDESARVTHLSRMTLVSAFVCQACGKITAQAKAVAFDADGNGHEVA